MTAIAPRKRADGTTAYRVQFRLPSRKTPTVETFGSADAAQQFIDLAGRVGWGEATALQVGDFDLGAQVPTVTISRAWKRGERGGVYLGSPKTRRGRRTVTLDDTTVAAIRHLIDRRPPEQLVFRGLRGARVHTQNFQPRVWQPAVAAAGIGKSPRIHDLRHSHASWLIAAGVPLPIIQYRLGHESIKTSVDRYGHLLPGAGELAAAAMEKVFSSLTVPLSGELLPRDELERSDAPDAPND